MSEQLLDFKYLTPKTVREACFLLSRYGGRARVIAGGTDFVLLRKTGEIAPQYVIDIKTISDLAYIRDVDGKGVSIGALSTMADVESSPIIKKKFPMLASAASQMGSPQIRNAATVAGNLCRSSPAADSVSPLIGLGASVKISSLGEDRVVSLEKFFAGVGENVVGEAELLTEIQIPNPPPNTRGVYIKWTPKTRIAVTAVGVAAVVTMSSARGGTVKDARIVLGAVAPTPIRARKAEAAIKGKRLSGALIEKAAQAAAEEAKPISDLRSPAGYRREMVKVLTRRALKELAPSA